jgi:hypothetical protein
VEGISRLVPSFPVLLVSFLNGAVNRQPPSAGRWVGGLLFWPAALCVDEDPFGFLDSDSATGSFNGTLGTWRSSGEIGGCCSCLLLLLMMMMVCSV